MDSRTRAKLMAQYTAMSHLLQRHYSVLPARKSYADILTDGMSAALALGLEEVRRETARPRETQAPALEDVAPVAVYEAPNMGIVPPHAGNDVFGGEIWGLGMSLPRGDM